ncbi:MAG: hypothetical protein ABEJ05_10180 [Haloglomus sp.]
MSARQGTLVAVVISVVAVVVAAPVVSGLAVTTGHQSTVTQTNETDQSVASLGAQISSFMQASAAEANGSVQSGMWRAEFNATNETARDRLIERRINRIERQLERLQNRMTALERAYENGTLPEVAYTAQASHLVARIDSLQDAINDTEAAAMRAGVNTTQLDRLREMAANATGHEVAQVARNLSVVTPRGPPPNAGPPEGAGPPGDVGPGDAGNGTDQGPPEDVGPGDAGNGTDQATSGDSGPGDAGNGTDQGPSEGTGPSGDDGDGGPPGDTGGSNDGGGQADGTDDSGSDDESGTGGGSGNGNPGGGPPGR